MSENQNIPVIEMRGVNVVAMRDTTVTVAEDVNWSVAAGEFWVVAGQQHSGKSDLLMLTAGLMTPAAGSYKLFGIETTTFGEAELAERLRVGFVFEGGHLFNQLSLAENVALPLRYRNNLTPEAAAQEVKPLLELMEFAPLADVTPANVAPNWAQRAALARALILKPEMLLLDNPLRGLGARHVRWWLNFLDQLSRGHAWLDGKPMTLIATAEDLQPWRKDSRRFALLRDKQFKLIGSWGEVSSQDDTIMRELLEVSLDTSN